MRSANPAEPARKSDPVCAKLYRGAVNQNRPFLWLFCGFFLPEAVFAYFVGLLVWPVFGGPFLQGLKKGPHAAAVYAFLKKNA